MPFKIVVCCKKGHKASIDLTKTNVCGLCRVCVCVCGECIVCVVSVCVHGVRCLSVCLQGVCIVCCFGLILIKHKKTRRKQCLSCRAALNPPSPTVPHQLPRSVAAAAVCGTHIIIHLSATCANFLCGFVCNCQQFARAQDAKIEINDNVGPPTPSLTLCLFVWLQLLQMLATCCHDNDSFALRCSACGAAVVAVCCRRHSVGHVYHNAHQMLK